MKLIYITGIDGCGKTTQSIMLTDYLNQQGRATQYQWLRWSPSIGRIISVLKGVIKGKGDRLSVHDNVLQKDENKTFKKWSSLKRSLFSFSLFRFLWLKYASWDYFFAYKKQSSDWNSEVVVLDRYYFDFIVDQSINYKESILMFSDRVNKGILKKIRSPDIFILIDITPQIGWERKRDGTSLAHLQQLYKAYKSFQVNEKVYVIDGVQTMQSIHNEIREIVTEFMEKDNGI